jgi:hypothetical protein
MNSLTLYQDKTEKMKFKLMVEGVSINNTKSRLCLELESGENLYFNGNINNNGECEINIPALKNYNGKGRAYIEVIAESSYFRLNEMNVNIDKKLDIKLESLSLSNNFSNVNESTKVTLTFIDELIKNDLNMDIDESSKMNEKIKKTSKIFKSLNK